MRELPDGTIKVDSDDAKAHTASLWVFRAIVVATALGLAVFIARQVL